MVAAVSILLAAGGTWWIAHRAAPRGALSSVAVLPFLNVGGDPANEYFSDGLSGETIQRLTKVPGLRVASQTSSFALKRSARNVREIGTRLNVESVVEGTVRRSGDRLEITVRLVAVAADRAVWSESYVRSVKDAFAVVDEITAAIARALGIERRGPLPVARPPASLAA
jgi:adenylate cyclase